MKQKQVMIPLTLYNDLVKFHLLGDSNPQLPFDIAEGLKAKQDANLRRLEYIANMKKD